MIELNKNCEYCNEEISEWEFTKNNGACDDCMEYGNEEEEREEEE